MILLLSTRAGNYWCFRNRAEASSVGLYGLKRTLSQLKNGCDPGEEDRLHERRKKSRRGMKEKMTRREGSRS